MSNLIVCTVAESEERLALLRESCKSVMITLTAHIASGDMLTVKILSFIPFLERMLTLAPEEYVMFVDGHDTLILKPEKDILAKVRAMDVSLLVSAERNCWPDSELADKYPVWPHVGNYPKYLNAGGYIGTKNAVLHALHTIKRHAETKDDQREWTRCYLGKLLPMVQLDHGRTIFSSIGDGDEALRADSCVKHWNGRTPGREGYWNSLHSPERREWTEAIPETMDQHRLPEQVEPGHSDGGGEVSPDSTGQQHTDDLPTSRPRALRVRRGRPTLKGVPESPKT